MKRLPLLVSLCFVALFLQTVFLAASAVAGLPLGGLTVAISPDGKTLVAGGDTRTLLVLDPESLEVKNRVWIETTINSLKFSKDGSTLVVGDTSDRVLFYNTKDWTKKSAIEKRARVAMAREANLIAGLEEDYSQGSSIFFHSVADGSVKGSIRFPKGERIVGLGLNPEGTKLCALYAEKEDSSEKKVEYKDIPKELKDLERTTFQQQNDGKVSQVAFFEVPSGKVLAQHKLFYTNPGCDIFLQGEKAYIVGASSVHATVTQDGKVELFALPSGVYGTGASPDHKLLLAGGMGNFTFAATDSLTPQNGNVSRLQGWPEYFKGFATNPAGPVYAATSGYRVMRIGRNANVEKEAPVK